MDDKNMTMNPITKQFNNHSLHSMLIYGIIDILLILTILSGNVLTICAVKLSRKLSAVLSNQFIFSLAVSDIMVGLTFPYHFVFFVVATLSTIPQLCILRFVLTILACSLSISNLLGIAMDRYIAIVYPLHYSRYMTKKVAVIIIFTTWIVALTVSLIPVFWNKWQVEKECTLHEVLTPQYINFIMTPMFASIWINMFIIYIRIWREATGHARRLRRSSSYQYGKSKSFNDSKSIQVVLLILGCFSICWLPFFIVIVIIKVDSPIAYEVTLRLAIANSCMNPIIYAWKNKNFRNIFWNLAHCKTPNSLLYNSSFITNYKPNRRKIVDVVNNEERKDIPVYTIKQNDSDNNQHYTDIGFRNKESSIDTVCTNISSLNHL